MSSRSVPLHRCVLEPTAGDAPSTYGVWLDLVETRTRGWRGSVVLDPAPGAAAGLDEAIAFAMERALLPGHPVQVRLCEAHDTDTGADSTPVRTWPSMIIGVDAFASDDPAGGALVRVLVHDPIGALWDVPLWGAFAQCAPGELLGAALALAAGADPTPTPAPVLPDAPAVRIDASLREAIDTIPYAIAPGEPLGAWIETVFAKLGIRMVIRHDGHDAVHVLLRDALAGDDPAVHTMTLDASSPPDETNASMAHLCIGAPWPERGTVLDNPGAGTQRRFGPSGTVGDVIDAARVGLDEAELRAGFAGEARRDAATLYQLESACSAMRPGDVVHLTNLSLDGAERWTARSVVHRLDHGRYLNRFALGRADVVPRIAPPARAGPTMVSAVVNDAQSPSGAEIARDALGRIPVTFVFSPGAGAYALAEPGGSDDDAGAPPPVIELPVSERMAGGVHGFMPAQRQGDYCRVTVHHPMRAQVTGFAYNDTRRINDGAAADLSAGVVVRHRDDAWSGVVFAPGEGIGDGDG